jgi:cathepsin L
MSNSAGRCGFENINMKYIVAVLLLVGLVSAFTEKEYQSTFMNWMNEYGKTYAAEEFNYRYNVFKFNMDYVNRWNAVNNETILGLNVFADLSNSEYQSLYLGTRFDASERLRKATPFTLTAPLADVVDWRTKGAVTAIKNQGQCGSCWSFSTTGSVEGVHFISSGTLVSLSEQNLMDCSTAYGNHGCNGGLMDNAFRYIIANHGIDTEDSYPYTARNGVCHFNTANIGATITSYKDVSAGSEDALASAVNTQPISVAIDASHMSFQLYKSGVYYEPACSPSRLDHGVLAVGYGSDGSSDYWIVKNSWGTVWGTQGYIQMSRNKNNNCGIATMSSYPLA